MSKNVIINGAELKLVSGLRELDDKYPKLNSGGCLFVAKWIGEAFRRKRIKVDYLILDNYPGDLTSIRKEFKTHGNTESLMDLNERMIEVAHIIVRVNGNLYIDSKGVATSINDTKWSYLHKMGYITHKTMLRWCNDYDYRWNPIFLHTHGHQLPRIENDIKNLIESLDI